MKLDQVIVELKGDVSSSPLYNEDIAPIGAKDRKWGMFDIAALWVGMAVCIPSYMLAASLIQQGMNWWQAMLTIMFGNIIVLGPMIANAHAGTKYGIPFPVYCRAAFGTLGAHIPSVLRGLVACGWFGIQAWIGGFAIYQGLLVFWPGLAEMSLIGGLGINAAQFSCFLFFWALNMGIVWRGMESIRHIEDYAAPVLIVMALGLLAWAYFAAGGFGEMLSRPSEFGVGGAKEGQFWKVFVPGLTGMVGFWATLSLNIPDFSRHAHDQREQIMGQALGLPTTMTFIAFIGVAVTSATVVIFGGDPIWDPVVILGKFKNPIVVLLAMLALTLATLSTNLAANVVSPAVGFSNLAPKRISFKVGALITGVIGIVIQPWKLVADPTGYIFTWLIGYSALLGSIAGVMLADYFWVRKTELDLDALYDEKGVYAYTSGFNPVAVFALVLGIAPCVPGFLGTIKVMEVSGFWMNLYSYAWFVSFGVSGVVYGLISKKK